MRRLLIVLCLGLLVVPAFAQGPMVPSAAVTSTVYNGTTPLLPRFRLIDSSLADTEIVPAVSGFRIRVLALHLTMTGTTVTLQFEDTTNGTKLTGAFQPTQGQTIVLPFNPVGWFQTTAGDSLGLKQSGTQSVDGSLVYVLVP